jgi:hypothetical protein
MGGIDSSRDVSGSSESGEGDGVPKAKLSYRVVAPRAPCPSGQPMTETETETDGQRERDRDRRTERKRVDVSHTIARGISQLLLFFAQIWAHMHC